MQQTPELAAFERFCSQLVLEEGSRMRLEAFQQVMLADYFAGTTETLILIPKKNGKTTLLGALALFHLITTTNAECVIGATSRDQATILYDQAAGFTRRTPGLAERVLVKRGYRELRSRRDAGRIRVLAAAVDTADGVIPTLALVDELHRAGRSDLYGVFRDGLGPRKGRMATISTAGDSEASALGVMRAAALRLPHVSLDGRHTYALSTDGKFALHEWALRADDDLHDLDVVKQANPASWQTLEALQLRHDAPSTLPWQWARFACGVWMAGETWWMDGEAWRSCEVDEALEPGDRISLGFDGARYGDATALVACRLSDGLVVPLNVWERPPNVDGWETPSGEIDAAIYAAYERFKVVRGYFDPPQWQSEIDEWSQQFGEPAVLRYATNRGRFMAAVERFRTDVAAGRVRHAGDLTLTRHVLNARMQTKYGGYVLSKDSQTSPNKIDAGVAAVLAYEARADALSAGALDPPPDRRLITF